MCFFEYRGQYKDQSTRETEDDLRQVIYETLCNLSKHDMPRIPVGFPALVHMHGVASMLSTYSFVVQGIAQSLRIEQLVFVKGSSKTMNNNAIQVQTLLSKIISFLLHYPVQALPTKSTSFSY